MCRKFGNLTTARSSIFLILIMVKYNHVTDINKKMTIGYFLYCFQAKLLEWITKCAYLTVMELSFIFPNAERLCSICYTHHSYQNIRPYFYHFFPLKSYHILLLVFVFSNFFQELFIHLIFWFSMLLFSKLFLSIFHIANSWVSSYYYYCFISHSG